MRKKILVADSSETILNVCRHHLTQRGYQVTLFQDGNTALAELRVSPYDLAIIATETGGLRGHDLLSRLRRDPNKAKLPVLMLLGSAELVDTEELFAVEPNATLNKPFSPEELLHQVEALLSPLPATEAEKRGDELAVENVLADDDGEIDQDISRASEKAFTSLLSEKNDSRPAATDSQLDRLYLEDAGDTDRRDFDSFINEISPEKMETPSPATDSGISETTDFEVSEINPAGLSSPQPEEESRSADNRSDEIYLEKLHEPLIDRRDPIPSGFSADEKDDLADRFIRHLAESLAKEIAARIDMKALTEKLELLLSETEIDSD